jgi:hypothetical protein
MATEKDFTLMGFAAIDLRDTKVGDVVVFRTGSLTHSKDLPLRHGGYAKVTGFARSSKGAQQVSVQFKDGAVIPMAPSNLVARTPDVDVAAGEAHGLVLDITAKYTEDNRQFLIVPSLQVALGEMGMYDRLREPTSASTAPELDDLPY